METEPLIIVSYTKRYIESYFHRHSPHWQRLNAEELNNRRGVLLANMGSVLGSEWNLIKVRWDDAPDHVDMVLSCNLSFN